MKVSQRWWISLPFLIALAVLVFLGWSASQGVAYPHDGINMMDPTGIIRELDPSGPTDELLQVGDKILFIDGKTVQEAQPLYGNKRPGDLVDLIVLRDGVTEGITFRLGVPTFERGY